MKLKIEAIYGNNKSRKVVTFDVDESVSQFFIDTFKHRRETGENLAEVEGNASMKINISILHSEEKF